MPFEFKLPDVGEGITEGEIIRWLVEPGDSVREDQPLVEMQTDKAVVELPSPRAGTIVQRTGNPGDVVPVGATLVVIEEAHGGLRPQAAEAAPPPVPAVPAPAREPRATPSDVRTRVQAAPATRRLAATLGVDLGRLAGTGPHGRVVPDDVRRVSATPVRAAAPEPLGGRRVVPLVGTRRVTAQHMSRAWADIPHVTVVEKLRADRLVEVRERLKAAGARDGLRVTYLPLVGKALALAVGEFPRFNARWEDGSLYEYADVDLGIAMETGDGLVVPVIRGAHRLSVGEFARGIEDLASRAAARRLAPGEMSGSTITLTGGGPLRGLFATPIINAPEVAILGMYPIRDEAWVVNGALQAGKTLYLSLTFDHRVADGSEASQFLARLVALLESPDLWILTLR